MQCGFASETFKQYEKHMNTHLVHCPTCDYSGLGLRSLRKHQKDAHGPVKFDEEKEIEQCEICGGAFLNLKQHMKSVHSERAFKCDLCDYTCTIKGYLTQHRKGHFLSYQECPICLIKVKSLREHIRRRHAKEKIARLPCDQCDKTFASSNGLKTHIENIHKQIKNFLCDLCNYKTYTISNLRIHVSKMHTRESLERICPVCHIKSNVIEKHLKTYHFEYYQQLQQPRQSDAELGQPQGAMNDDGQFE